MDKICPVCQKTFTLVLKSPKTIQKYCSIKCRDVVRNRKRNRGINKKTNIPFKSNTIEYFHAYSLLNPKPSLKIQRETNPEHYQLQYEKAKASQRKVYASLRKQVTQYLGGKCVYCGCDVYNALEINHVNGGGAKELRTGKKRKGHAPFYREILANQRKDVELVCRVCNSVHYLKLKGIEGYTVVWRLEK